MDVAGVLRSEREPLGAALGGQDRIAVAREDSPRDLPNALFVLDDENRLSPARGRRVGRFLRARSTVVRDGEDGDERGTRSRLGRQLGVAAGLGDDAVHGREPEAGSLALRLLAEEGLEDVRRDLWFHARAGVAHSQANVRADLCARAPRRVVLVDPEVL